MQTNAAISFAPIAAPQGHRTAVHTTLVTPIGSDMQHIRHVLQCACGHRANSRAALAAHHRLAALGVK